MEPPIVIDDREELDERKRLAVLARIYDVARRRLEFVRVHKTHTDAALDFSDRPYLRELVNEPDFAEDICKCVQIGVTEMIITLVFAAAAEGLSVLVALPTLAQRSRYVHNRIDRPMEYVPLYRDLQKSVPDELDNVGMKAFGAGVITFVSAETRRSFRETPADVLIIEEFDECDQDILKLAYGRLKGSDYKLTVRIANPTTPDTGIAKLYKQTTKREWHVTCPACGVAQQLDWFENVVRKLYDDDGQLAGYELRDAEWKVELDRDIRVYCRECGARIDRLEADPEKAFWRDTNPGVARRGRHFTQLMMPGTPVRELWSEFKKAQDDDAAMAVFYQERLGLGYTSPGSKLTPEILDSCRSTRKMPDAARAPTWAGLDIGTYFDLRIERANLAPGGAVREMVFADKLRSKAMMLKAIERYEVCMIAADAQPEKHLLEELQAQLGHVDGVWRLWRIQFVEGDTIESVKIHEETGVISVGRTWAFDRDQTAHVRRRIILPRDARSLCGGEFYTEMCKSERQLKQTPDGRRRYVWSRSKPDHQRLASVYANIAAMYGGYLLPHVRETITEPAVEGEFVLT